MKPQANPKMMVLGRESRGLTQSELAATVGISQARISKIEAGLLPLSGEMLKALSSALEYPEHFFLQDEELYGIDTSILFHRKRQTVAIKTLNKIHAMVNIRRIHVAKMLKAAEIEPAKSIPRFDIEEFDGQVEDVARAVRASWVLPKGPIQNVTKTIEDAGGIVIKCDFGTRMIDAISQWIVGLPPLFFVNSGVPGDRMRFSLAHELGHVIMHNTVNTDLEDQANRFAASFLMPADDIRHSLGEITVPKLAVLKPYWKVSMGALLKRAADLGRITERQERYIWMQFSKAGYRLREPAELDIPPEEPQLLAKLIDLHRTRLQYSITEFSHLIALREKEVKAIYFGQSNSLRLV